MLQSDCVWTGILLWTQVVTSTNLYTRIDINYNELLDAWQHHTLSTPPKLRSVLIELNLPEANAPAKHWYDFITNLRNLLTTHHDIGYIWALDTAQLERLTDYLTASTRMLECLDLAAVADRDAIRNRLLLPPQL